MPTIHKKTQKSNNKSKCINKLLKRANKMSSSNIKTKPLNTSVIKWKYKKINLLEKNMNRATTRKYKIALQPEAV